MMDNLDAEETDFSEMRKRVLNVTEGSVADWTGLHGQLGV
jgi:hypothetical protein